MEIGLMCTTVKRKLHTVYKKFNYRFGGMRDVANEIRTYAMAGIPVFVPCFNNTTYCRFALKQLHDRGVKNVIFVDNASNDEAMLNFLDEPDTQKIRLNCNLGPRSLVYFDKYYKALPDIFCISDPDLIFSQEMPSNFLDILLKLSEEAKIGKVGLALKIDDSEAMRDEELVIASLTTSIVDWERQFWINKYDTKIVGDPVYRACVDTTLAVYNKKYFQRKNFLEGLRVAGRFSARHDPWYKIRLISDIDALAYANKQKYSTLFHIGGSGV